MCKQSTNELKELEQHVRYDNHSHLDSTLHLPLCVLVHRKEQDCWCLSLEVLSCKSKGNTFSSSSSHLSKSAAFSVKRGYIVSKRDIIQISEFHTEGTVTERQCQTRRRSTTTEDRRLSLYHNSTISSLEETFVAVEGLVTLPLIDCVPRLAGQGYISLAEW